MLRWLWGAVAQWSEHLQLKQEALGSIPGGYPGFFFTSSWLTNVDGMKDLWCSSSYSSAAINTDMNRVKDLWCSSTVRLLSTIDTNGRVCGALVQFGCYQHRHE